MAECKFTDSKQGYHFVECGLDYIYLLNGYELTDDPEYGELFCVHNSEELHKEIAKNILLHKETLRAQEVRFFRSLLQITQKQLADWIGVDEKSVRRWEDPQDDTNIKAGNDGMLRILVWDKFLGKKDVVKHLEKCKQQRTHYKLMSLLEKETGWEANLAA